MTEATHLYLQWLRFWLWTPIIAMKELPGAWTIYNLYKETASVRRFCNTQRERIDDLERRCLCAGL